MSKRFLIIPILYMLFAAISLTVIQSIAPSLILMQTLFFIVGGIGIAVTSFIPLSIWQKTLPILYLGTIIFLLIPLALGIVTRGAAAWIPIGPFHLQPSQFAQPICLLTASYFLSKHSLKNWKHIFQFSLLCLLPLGLIFIEPDFGTFIVLSGALASLAFFSDLPFTRMSMLLFVVLLLGVISWQFLLQPYQKARITSFFTSDQNSQGSYHAEQSVIAVGSGQIVGRGLGHGVQSQLRFLPERQTDFIFASLAEETGFLGSSFVVLLYSILLGYLLITTQHFAFRSTEQLFILGSAVLLFIQIFINIGMNSKILPITGITLPFISYGGSSLLSFAFLLGLIQQIIITNPTKHFRHIR